MPSPISECPVGVVTRAATESAHTRLSALTSVPRSARPSHAVERRIGPSKVGLTVSAISCTYGTLQRTNSDCLRALLSLLNDGEVRPCVETHKQSYARLPRLSYPTTKPWKAVIAYHGSIISMSPYHHARRDEPGGQCACVSSQEWALESVVRAMLLNKQCWEVSGCQRSLQMPRRFLMLDRKHFRTQNACAARFRTVVSACIATCEQNVYHGQHGT